MQYLAVANYFDGSSRMITSKIFVWNGTEFREVQAVPTNGAFDSEHFEIDGKHYLAVASQGVAESHIFELPGKRRARLCVFCCEVQRVSRA